MIPCHFDGSHTINDNIANCGVFRDGFGDGAGVTGWGLREVFDLADDGLGFMVAKVGFSTSCVDLCGKICRVWLRPVGTCSANVHSVTVWVMTTAPGFIANCRTLCLSRFSCQ